MNTAGVPTSCQKYQFFVTTNTTGHYPDISLKTLCFVTTNTAGDFLTSCQKYVISWLQMFKHWPFIKTIQWRHTYKCWNMSSERDVTRTDVNVSVVCRNVKYQHVDLQSDLCSTSCSSSWMSERHCVECSLCTFCHWKSVFTFTLKKCKFKLNEGGCRICDITNSCGDISCPEDQLNTICIFTYSGSFYEEEGRSFLGFNCGNYKHVRGLCVYREL